MKSIPRVSYLVINNRQTVIVNNNPDLLDFAPYVSITQDMLYEDPLGECKSLQLADYTLLFTTSEPYFFVAGTGDPVGILFLQLLLQKLKQITLSVIGPNTDVNRLFAFLFCNCFISLHSSAVNDFEAKQAELITLIETYSALNMRKAPFSHF